MLRHSVPELGDEGMEARGVVSPLLTAACSPSSSSRGKQEAAEDYTRSSRTPAGVGVWRTASGNVTLENDDVFNSESSTEEYSLFGMNAIGVGVQVVDRVVQNVDDVGPSPRLGRPLTPPSVDWSVRDRQKSKRQSPARISSPGVHASSPRVSSPRARVSSPLVRYPRARVGSPLVTSLREARPRSPISLIRKTYSRAEFAKTSYALQRQSETGIQRLIQLRHSLMRQMKSSQAVLDKGTLLMEECGQAFASWFGALSGPALEDVIKEAFDKFDTEKSGLLDQQKFEKAMHALGLRLTADKYRELFEKFDEDRSGEVDIHEFMHMIKYHLKKPCSNKCPVCLRDGGSNLLSAYFRERWDEDESKWAPAASTLQAFTTAKPVLASYAQFVQEKTAASTLQAFVASKSTRESYIREIQEERHKKLHAEYQARWDEDETKWAPAASTLQAFVNAKPSQTSYSQVVREVAALEDAIEAATAAIVQQILIEEREVVVQEAIEEEVAAAESEETVVMGGDDVIPRTCGAYIWDFRLSAVCQADPQKKDLPSVKPIRTRTHPFIRRYALFTEVIPARTHQTPPLSSYDFSSASTTSLPTSPFLRPSTSDTANFGRRQEPPSSSTPRKASFTPRKPSTVRPQSYPSLPSPERSNKSRPWSPGWSTSPKAKLDLLCSALQRNDATVALETVRSSGALTDRRVPRTQTSSLLNSTDQANSSPKLNFHWFASNGHIESFHCKTCAQTEARLHTLMKLRTVARSHAEGLPGEERHRFRALAQEELQKLDDDIFETQLRLLECRQVSEQEVGSLLRETRSVGGFRRTFPSVHKREEEEWGSLTSPPHTHTTGVGRAGPRSRRLREFHQLNSARASETGMVCSGYKGRDGKGGRTARVTPALLQAATLTKMRSIAASLYGVGG
jgi:hypothetical protein